MLREHYCATNSWQLRKGPTHTGTIISDPLLAGYPRTAAFPNCKPSVSSPVTGRGAATQAPKPDIDGRPRKATTGDDMALTSTKPS